MARAFDPLGVTLTSALHEPAAGHGGEAIRLLKVHQVASIVDGL